MSPKLGDWTNHRRRLLDRGRGFNLGGDIFSPTERVIGARAGSVATTPDSSTTVFLQPSHKPNDKKILSEENKQFDPGGKEGEPPPWKEALLVVFSFSGEGRWAWVPLLVFCALCFCLCLPVCLLCKVLIR